MARKALCVLGGVFMIISLFLPVFYTHVFALEKILGRKGEWLIFYWMIGFYFGLGHIIFVGPIGNNVASHGFLGNQINVFGVMCMVIIMIGAIVALATSGKHSNMLLKKAPFIGGLIGLLGMMMYFIGFYIGVYYGIHLSPLSTQILHFLPFIGFYVCLLGSYLTIFGGLKD